MDGFCACFFTLVAADRTFLIGAEVLVGKLMLCSGTNLNPSNKLNAPVAKMNAPIIFNKVLVEAAIALSFPISR
jgi:hypothetical protein